MNQSTEAGSVTTQTLTLDLPEALFRYLEQIARVTHQPLERIAAQSIAGNLPPFISQAPPEIQAEIADLQALSASELRQIADAEVPPDQAARHLDLLARNSDGTLNESETAELAHLRLAADQLMLRKAYAAAVLRWLGDSEYGISDAA
jgi:hypothetical protein